MKNDIYNSCVEVDMPLIKENIAKIREGIGPNKDIIAVLKGNAYGMGLKEIAQHLTENCGINTLACAQTCEAIQFREIGFEKDILVMGGVPFNNIEAVVENNIHTPAYNRQYLNLLNSEALKQGKTAEVHIKIETGLNRIGVLPGEDLDEFCQFLNSLSNVKAVGIYTHFAESDAADKTFTYEQAEKFNKAYAQTIALGFNFKYVHICNTAASTWLDSPILTHIRPAGLLFGFDCNVAPKNLFNLKEVISWRTFITNIKNIEAGETIGYDRAYKADKPIKMATISVGYGDGYPRRLAAQRAADMIVNGCRARIIGVCMDQIFLDITGIEANINDTVTLMGHDGNEHISVFELQEKMGETYLVSIATIANRVKRKYIY